MANNPTHVVTGKARLSYCNLTRPVEKPNQDPKYSVTVLIPKSDVSTMQRIGAAIEAAKQAGEKVWNGRPPLIAVPVHDGDGARPSDGMPFGNECKGHWVFTASCKADRKPEIVDAQMNPITDATAIYSGMYGRVSVNFFAYANNGKKGVGCGLNNVQKLADGEPLGSRTSADEDFEAVPDSQPGQAPYGATPYQPPLQQAPQYQQPPQGYGYPPQQVPAYAYPPHQIPQAPYPAQQTYNQPAQWQPPQAAPQGYPQAPQQGQQQAVDPITGQPQVYGI